MDASGLVRLTCAINAFGARGDGDAVPVTAAARAAATKAAAFLTRRLVFSHLRGDGVSLDLAGLRDLAAGLDALVAEGDGLKTGLAEAEILQLWTLRLGIQERMALHPEGGAAARGLDLSPLGRAAWRVAEAAAARVPGAPHWPRSILPPPEAEAEPIPAAPAVPADAAAPLPEREGEAGHPAPALPAGSPEATGSPLEADGKPHAALGLFSRAILRLHDAVENMAAPPRPEAEEAAEAARPARGKSHRGEAA